MDTRHNRGRNDYSIYEKSYLKKSKKILNKLEESRSKSNSRIGLNISRSVSPVAGKNNHSQIQVNLVDTKKYLDMKKESGGIFNKKKSADRLDRSEMNSSGISGGVNNSTHHQTYAHNNKSNSSSMYNNYLNMSKTNNKSFQNTNNNYNSEYISSKTVKENVSNSNVKHHNKQNSQNYMSNGDINYLHLKNSNSNNSYLNSTNNFNQSQSGNKSYVNSSNNYVNTSQNYGNNRSRDVSGGPVKKVNKNLVNSTSNYQSNNNYPSGNSGNKVIPQKGGADYLNPWKIPRPMSSTKISNNKNNQNYENNYQTNHNPNSYKNKEKDFIDYERSRSSVSPNHLKTSQNKTPVPQYRRDERFAKEEVKNEKFTPNQSLSQTRPKINNPHPSQNNNFNNNLSQTNLNSNNSNNSNPPSNKSNQSKGNNSNIQNNHIPVTSPPIEINTNPDSIYTHYKKVKKTSHPNLDNTQGQGNINTMNNIPIPTTESNYMATNTNSNIINTSVNHQNLIFDKTFGKESEISEKIRFDSQNYSKMNTESNITNNKNKFRLESKESFSYSGTNSNVNMNSSFKDNKMNSFVNNISNNNTGSIHSPHPSDKNINKETTDSTKFKMTSTHSATNSIEVMTLFNKGIDNEEAHFVSVSLIQNSRRVIRAQENLYERENVYCTVTKFDERDL